MDLLNQIEFWHWLIAALVMIILEMLIPAAYFLWMGISAFIIGLLLYLIPTMPLLVQVILFCVMSIIGLCAYKHYKRKNPTKKQQHNLNRRGEHYVGRTFTLEEPVVNGIGKVRVDDSSWKVKGNDMPAGVTVRVLSVEGTILNVKEEAVFSD